MVKGFARVPQLDVFQRLQVEKLLQKVDLLLQ